MKRIVENGKKIVAYFFCAFIVIFFVILVIRNGGKGCPVEHHQAVFENDWTFVEGTERDRVSLPINRKVAAGEWYWVEKKLPNVLQKDATIAFLSLQQEVQVYVEEDLIYRYPMKKYIGGALPNTWNFVRIPIECGGEKIRIGFRSPFAMYSGRISEISYGNYETLFYQTRKERLPLFWVSISIGMVGLGLAIMSVLPGAQKKPRPELILGLLLCFVATWLCGELQMPMIYLGPELLYYMTFVSLMLCPVCFLCYIRTQIRIGRRYTNLFIGGTAVAAVSCLIAQLLEIRSFIEDTSFLQLMMAAAFLYGMILYAIALKRHPESYSKWEFLVMLTMLTFMVVEIVIYYTSGRAPAGMYMRSVMFVYSCYLFLNHLYKIRKIQMENRRLTEELYESKVDLLMSQIQPHFIYNTLNSIRTLIRIDPDEAYKMVLNFSNYLRANIDSIGVRTIIPFHEELKHIEAYVEIEKVRFADRLNVEMDIQADGFSLPPLCVQAIVENAIKHGVCKKIEGGTVWLRSYEVKHAFVVEVEDDGVGFQPDHIPVKKEGRRSAGLHNIRTRLERISNATLRIESQENVGTKVTIEFPKE